jgi:sec-independent protein translocase protein TatC
MSTQAQSEMSIWDHLNELRSRLLKAVIALAITTAISFSQAQLFIEFLTKPVGGLQKVQSIEVTENISVFMRVSLLSGAILAMPIIVYQLLAYILPGLTKDERKYIYWAVPTSTLLFLAGVVFAFYVMLPAATQFLVSFLGVPTTPRLSNYINFTTNLLFWIGVSFETPLFVYILARFRIVSAKALAKQWRIAIVVIAVLAASITPTVDPVNMSLLMAPLMVLYLISILLAHLAQREPKTPKA